MKPRPSQLTAERLRKLFHYNMESGDFTRIGTDGSMPKKYLGKKAGCLKDGYIYVKVDGRAYMAHRLAWLYVTGHWPDCLIDHEDTNGTNNRWTNLREANYSQNGANSKTSRVLPKGVYKNKYGYVAIIVHNYECIHLGSFRTIVEASSAYTKEAISRHGKFARSA